MSNFIKLSLSLLLIIVADFSFSQTTKDIVFENPTQKFKRVNEGHQLSFLYRFNYTGSLPLSIIPPKVDCSCTEVILPENNILPNSDHEIVVTFDTNDKIGYQERTVFIHFVSDAMDGRFIEKKITFKGTVKATKQTQEKYKQHPR